jgi:hypothetical protein
MPGVSVTNTNGLMIGISGSLINSLSLLMEKKLKAKMRKLSEMAMKRKRQRKKPKKINLLRQNPKSSQL